MCPRFQFATAFAVFTFFGLASAAIGAPSAFEIGPSNTDQLPAGKEADGIIGDYECKRNVLAVNPNFQQCIQSRKISPASIQQRRASRYKDDTFH